MAIRDFTKLNQTGQKVNNAEITNREFGESAPAMWSNREKDWYNAERRFIFATKTEK